MELLYKKGEYIVDVEEGKVFCEDHQSSFSFNFDEWFCYSGARRSTPQPIRYDSEKDIILYWANKQWNTWSEQKNEAIVSLFHTYMEWKLIS